MTNLEKHCLGFECETAKNCRLYMRKTHPHDVLFMSSVTGKDCPWYEPVHEDDDHDND